MGNPNSKSSFKNNNSLASSINFLNSYFHQIILMDKLIKMQMYQRSLHGNMGVIRSSQLVHFIAGNKLFPYCMKEISLTQQLQVQGMNLAVTTRFTLVQLGINIRSYKFIVDGQWRFSPEDPSIPDNYGNINNCIDTTDFQPMTTNIKKKTQQRLKDRIEYKEVEQLAQTAPKVPPHYEYCDYLHGQIPKNPANQNKGNSICKMSSQIKQFEQSLNEEEVYELFNSQHCFRPPTHATVNHLIHEQASSYSSISMTQRFKSKYTTYRYFLRQGELQ